METYETEMSPPCDTHEPVVLAVASVDTKGGAKIGEDMGDFWGGGISQD